jgi:hypothetical protein
MHAVYKLEKVSYHDIAVAAEKNLSGKTHEYTLNSASVGFPKVLYNQIHY